MRAYYDFAGLVVETDGAYLAGLPAEPYRCAPGKPDLQVWLTEADLAFERQRAARTDAAEGKPERAYTDRELQSTALLRKVTGALLDRDTLLFHGSAIAVDGRAFLFTAKSGTGKSTHARLWRELLGERAVMINDDKPFLRISGEGVWACGSPWCGKHRLSTPIQAPLAAVCILERGADNQIEELAPQEALFMLLQQSARPEDPAGMPRYLALMDRLAASVRFYRLQCNISADAARLAFGTMAKD